MQPQACISIKNNSITPIERRDASRRVGSWREQGTLCLEHSRELINEPETCTSSMVMEHVLLPLVGGGPCWCNTLIVMKIVKEPID